MSGVTSIGIIPRTTYDFRELRQGTVRVPVAQRIDVAGATSLALELWVFDARIGAGASVTLQAASDGYSPDSPNSDILQTKTAKGDKIAEFVIDSKTALPLYQTIKVLVEDIGRCLALILEVRGGADGGPHLSLAIDLLMRGTKETEDLVEADVVQPIVTHPEAEEGVAGPAKARIASATRQAMMRKPLRRYPRWREIVV